MSSKSKNGRGRVLLGGALVTLMCVPALGGPEGGKVVKGSAKIKQRGDRTIIRAADNTIINFSSFDIAGHESVRFIQPGGDARVLNRIESIEPTRIDGALRANGHVYLVNPSGVIFGENSIVNVGALSAAAGNISDSDFLGGIDRFMLTGDVTNMGTIRGDHVVLAGQSVSNLGTIIAREGFVAMVSGDEVLIGERDGRMFAKIDSRRAEAIDHAARASGVTNAGAILASDGQVIVGAGDFYGIVAHTSTNIVARDVLVESGDGATTRVAGRVDVSGEANGRDTGGVVRILGERVAVENAAIDASGVRGGGEVLIGGEFQGRGPERNALRTFVDGETTINADAIERGAGGRVIVWGDELTGFAGDVSARGGASGGDGGFVEISGKRGLIFRGDVNVLAPSGRDGTILFDPDNITIIDGAGGADDGELADNEILGGDGGAVDFIISEQALEALSGSVILQANDNIIVDDLTDNELSFAAIGGDTVEITADFDNDGTGTFSMAAGDAITTQGGALQITGGAVNFSGSSLATNGGDVTISATGLVNLGSVTTGGGNLSALADSDANGAGNLTISGAITTSGGNARFAGNDWIVGGSGSVAAGAGDVSFDVTTAQGVSLGVSGGVDLDATELATIGTTGAFEVGTMRLGAASPTTLTVEDFDLGGAGTILGDVSLMGTGTTTFSTSASSFAASLALDSGDFDVQVGVDAGDLSFDRSAGGTFGLGDTAGNATLSTGELALLTATTLSLDSTTIVTITLDNVALPNISGQTTLNAGGVGGEVIFQTGASILPGALSVEAASGITIGANVTSGGSTTFDVASGVIDVTGAVTVDSQGGLLNFLDAVTLDTGSVATFRGTGVDLDSTLTGDTGAEDATFDAGTAALTIGGATTGLGDLTIEDAGTTTLAGVTISGTLSTTNALTGAFSAGAIGAGTVDLDGTSFTLDAITTSVGGVTITNTAQADFGGDVSSAGAFAQDGAGAARFSGGAAQSVSAVGASSVSGAATIATGTNLLIDGAGVTFSSTIDGQSGAENLTIDSGVGAIGVAGAITDLDNLTIQNAGNATFSGDVTIAGTFSTSNPLTGDLSMGGNALSAGDIDLDGVGFTFDQVDTTVGGFTLTNTGTATFNADVTTAGAFDQDGSGGVSIDGDFDSTNSAISFAGDVLILGEGVSGERLINAGTGALTIGGALDGQTFATTLRAREMTFSGGNGSITGTGALAIEPAEADDPLNIGLTDLGDAEALNLTLATLRAVGGTFDVVVFGHDAGTHVTEISGLNDSVDPANIFDSPMRINAGGGLTVLDDLTVSVDDPHLKQITIDIVGDTTIDADLTISALDADTGDVDPAGDARIRFNDALSIGANDLTLASRRVEFLDGDASVTGTGVLAFTSAETDDPMNIGTTDFGESNAFNIDLTSLRAIDNTFQRVAFGASGGTNQIDVGGLNDSTDAANVFDNPMLFNAGGGLTILDDLLIDTSANPNALPPDLSVLGDTTIGAGLTVSVRDGAMEFDGLVDLDGNDLTLQGHRIDPLGGADSVDDFGAGVSVSTLTILPDNASADIDLGLIPVGQEGTGLRFGRGDMEALGSNLALIQFGFDGGAHVVRIGRVDDLGGIDARLQGASRFSGSEIRLFDTLAGFDDASFAFDGNIVIAEGAGEVLISTIAVDEFGVNPGAGGIFIGGTTSGVSGGAAESLRIDAARDVQFGMVSGDGAGNADATGLTDIFFAHADDVTFFDTVTISGSLASDSAARMTGGLIATDTIEAGSIDLTGTLFVFDSVTTTAGGMSIDNSSSLALTGDLSLSGDFTQRDTLGTGSVALTADIDTTAGMSDGDVSFASPVIAGGDGPRMITAGTGEIAIANRFDVSFSLVNSDARVIFTANGYDFSGDVSLGQVLTSSGDQDAEIIFRPADTTTSIDIGSGLAGPPADMVFGFGDLSRVDGTFSLVRFGYETTGAHDIRIGEAINAQRFRNDTIFHAPMGTIQVAGAIAGDGSLTFDTGMSVHLGADISTDGGDVTFGDGLILSADSTISTGDSAGEDEAAGAITINGAIDGDGLGDWSLTLDASNDVLGNPDFSQRAGNVFVQGAIGANDALMDLTVHGQDVSLGGIGAADAAGVLGTTMLSAQDDLILRGGLYTTRSAVYGAGDEIRPVTDTLFDALGAGSTLDFVAITDGQIGGADDSFFGIRLENGSSFTARTRGGDITIERGFARVGEGFASVVIDAAFGGELDANAGDVSVGERIGFVGNIVTLADDTIQVAAAPVGSVDIRGLNVSVLGGARSIMQQTYTSGDDGVLMIAGDFDGIAEDLSAITFAGNTMLVGDTSVTTFGGEDDDVLFAGTIDGAFKLDVDTSDAGSVVTGDNGSVEVAGLIGGSIALDSLGIEGFDVVLNGIGTSDSIGVTGATVVSAFNDLTLNGGHYNARAQDYNSDGDILIESVDALASFFSNGGELAFGTASGGDIPRIMLDPGSSILFDSRSDVSAMDSVGGDVLIAGNLTTTLEVGDAPVGLVEIQAGTGRALVAGVGGTGSIVTGRAIEELLITADEIDLAGDIVVERVTLQQASAGRTIVIGGDAGAAGQLDLLEEEFARIQNGTDLITIGSEFGQGEIIFEKLSLFDPLLVRLGDGGTGAIRVRGAIAGSDDASVEFAGDGTIAELLANITTDGGRVVIENNVLVGAAGVEIATGGGDPDGDDAILIDGTINSSVGGEFDLTLRARPEGSGAPSTDDAGNIRLNGRIGRENPLAALTLIANDNAIFARIGDANNAGVTGLVTLDAIDNNIFNANLFNAGGFDLFTGTGGDGDPHTRLVSGDKLFIVGSEGFRVSKSDLRIRGGIDVTIESASEVRIENGIRVDLADGSDADTTQTDILIDAEGQNVFLSGRVGDLAGGTGSPGLRPGTLTIDSDTIELGENVRLLIAGRADGGDALVLDADILGNDGENGFRAEVGNTLLGDNARSGNIVIRGDIGSADSHIRVFEVDRASSLSVSGQTHASGVNVESVSEAAFSDLVRVVNGSLSFLGGSVEFLGGIDSTRGDQVTSGDNAVSITAPTVTILEFLRTGNKGNVEILVSGQTDDSGLTFAGADADTPFVFDLAGDFFQRGNGIVRMGAEEIETRGNETSFAGLVELTFGDSFRIVTRDFTLEPLGSIDSARGSAHSLTIRLVDPNLGDGDGATVARGDIDGSIGASGRLRELIFEVARSRGDAPRVSDHLLTLDGRTRTSESTIVNADLTIDGDSSIDVGGQALFNGMLTIDAVLDVFGRGSAFNGGRTGSLDAVFAGPVTSSTGDGVLNVTLDADAGDGIEFNNLSQDDQIARLERGDSLPTIRIEGDVTNLASLHLNALEVDENGVPTQTRARSNPFDLDRLPTAATIVLGPTDLTNIGTDENPLGTITIEVDEFVVGFHEILSAHGDLRIIADTVSLGDTNVLGIFALSGPDGGRLARLNLLRRPTGEDVRFVGFDSADTRTLPNANSEADLVVVGFERMDGSAERFVDGEALFVSDIGEISQETFDGTDVNIFRVSLREGLDGLTGIPGDTGTDGSREFARNATVLQPISPVTLTDFLLAEGLGGAEINGIAGGAIGQFQAAAAQAAAAAAAESLVDVPDTTPASTIGEDTLRDVDIVLRDLAGPALIDALIGRAVYADLPLDPLTGSAQITSDRLSFRTIDAIRGQIAVVLPSENPGFVQFLLEDASVAFQDQMAMLPGQDPAAFADFVFAGNHPDLTAALRDVAILRGMIRNDLVGLTPGETLRAENGILRQITPAGMDASVVTLLIDRAEGNPRPVVEPVQPGGASADDDEDAGMGN